MRLGAPPKGGVPFFLPNTFGRDAKVRDGMAFLYFCNSVKKTQIDIDYPSAIADTLTVDSISESTKQTFGRTKDVW